MDSRIVDLHVHSTESDGTFTPEELITEAQNATLSAIALTDHDTVSGVRRAKEAAKGTLLEVISGIELSCFNDDHEVHMVGLFIDETNPAFLAKLKEFQDSRDLRNEKMIKNLQSFGFSITMEALYDRFPESVITRAHIARYLYENKEIPDLAVAFQKYIGDHCPCYVPREKISPIQAIELIQMAGGIAILAHPLLYHLSTERLKKLMIQLKEHGLTGVEAIYSTHSTGEELQIKQLAANVGLAISGGSDFHGANKPSIKLGTGKGRLYIPYSVLDNLKNIHQAHLTDS